MSRTVTLNIDAEHFLDIHRNAHHTLAAIGYLATWAMGQDDTVTISASTFPEMHEILAVYRKEDHTIVMGAIYRRANHPTEWEFHT